MLNIGRKTYRNLPEQVGFLTGEVAKIWEALDGMDVYDNVVILENLDPLTPAQLEIINKPVAFIVYSNTLFMKRGVGVDKVYFDAVFQVSSSSGKIDFASAEIIVNYPLGNLTYSGATVTTYDKTALDNYFATKADKDDTYTKTQIDNFFLSKVFPVGAIYMSVDSTSPALLFGGTWQEYNSGNQINICQADDLAPVLTGDNRADSSPRPMVFFNGSNQELTANTGLGVGSSASLGVHDAGVTTVTGAVHPANLWANVGTSIKVYMWQRIPD